MKWNIGAQMLLGLGRQKEHLIMLVSASKQHTKGLSFQKGTPQVLPHTSACAHNASEKVQTCKETASARNTSRGWLPEAAQRLLLVWRGREGLEPKECICQVMHPQAVGGRMEARPVAFCSLLHSPVRVCLLKIRQESCDWPNSTHCTSYVQHYQNHNQAGHT